MRGAIALLALGKRALAAEVFPRKEEQALCRENYRETRILTEARNKAATNPCETGLTSRYLVNTRPAHTILCAQSAVTATVNSHASPARAQSEEPDFSFGHPSEPGDACENKTIFLTPVDYSLPALTLHGFWA